MEQVRSNRW